jgi:hypothetical protein
MYVHAGFLASEVSQAQMAQKLTETHDGQEQATSGAYKAIQLVEVHLQVKLRRVTN